MRYCGKILYSRTDHRCQYGACALHFGYLRLQTHSEYVIFTAFSMQQDIHKRASSLRCLARFNVQSHAEVLKYSYALTFVRPFLPILLRNLRSLRRFCVINRLYISIHAL